MDTRALEIGKGWKLVPHLSADEVLIAKTAEISGGHDRFFWLCLDFARGRSAELPVKARLPGGDAPAINRRTNELVFPGEKGIVGFSLTSRQERLIVPINSEHHYVRQIWLSDEEDPRLLYLLAHYASGEKQHGVSYTYSLHSARLDSTPARLVADFQGLPVSMDIDWSRNTAVAFVQKEEKRREREIVEIDLADGGVSVLGATPLMHMTLSPKRTRLAWMGQEAGIRETLPDGREAVLTEFGGLPSYSPDGKRLAFSVADYEIWLRGPENLAPEKVVSLPAALSRHAGDRIVWCLCGKHFAVCLAGPKEPGNTLVIADCGRREIVLREDLLFMGTAGDRVWVPAAAVEAFF